MRAKERFLSFTADQHKSTGKGANFVIMSSGTTVVSVSGANVKSGDLVFTTVMQHANTAVASGSGVSFIGLQVSSVRNGAFEITAIGSRAPVGDMPIGWMIVRR